MRTAGRKWEAIDLMQLYSRGDYRGWNVLLRDAFKKADVQGLKKLLYGVQAGMTDLEKSGLVDEKIALWFIRIQRSLENTAKQIFREKYPNPLDNPLIPKTSDVFQKAKLAKAKRDLEFETFLREARF